MAITNIYKGALERSDIQKIYKGTTLLYEKVLPQAETWLINESPSINNDTNINESINFICYPQGIETNGTNIHIYRISEKFGAIIANTNLNIFQGSWAGPQPQIRTLIFETAPTGDLLTWLQANAVKQ